MLDQVTLEMLFEELGEDAGMTFLEWQANNPGWEDWTDSQIYSALPDVIKAFAADIVMNASWYHDGM